MKASRELKKWQRALVKLYGKKNGVVRGCYFDSPEMEVKAETNKHIKRGKDEYWKNEINA
jgi:hypothetical protein